MSYKQTEAAKAAVAAFTARLGHDARGSTVEEVGGLLLALRHYCDDCGIEWKDLLAVVRDQYQRDTAPREVPKVILLGSSDSMY